ncbi:MAG: 2Fe-2S iron-sulfur cluster-binding protein [Chloroflexi bacterium]|nr:2Fe-2S iron-sulfur cluster-binding protein [Chloroflexota bacterium]MCY3936925.1 2Fe-2S iron-sulfur cluster-binding protein [Chloroflexota bacterium]
MTEQRLGLRIIRYDPETYDSSETREYEVPTRDSLTLLDALVSIHEEQDSSLAIRYSCRGGFCGACGVQVNGLPVLACRTRVSSLDCNGSPVEIAPLQNHPVIRDLVADFDPTFLTLGAGEPWIQSDEGSPGSGMDSDMTQEEVDRLGRSQACISCGLCDAAVPHAHVSAGFVGPAALVREFRLAADVRDGSDRDRLERVNTSGGIWDCDPDNSWDDACPVGIDPANKIELLREASIANKIGGRKRVESETAA